MFIEKRLTLRDMPRIILRAMRITAMVMFIIAASGGFGWLVAQEQLALKLAAWLSAAHCRSAGMMLLVVNLFLFLICSVMDEIAIMVILGPMLIVLANQVRRRSDPFRRDHRHQCGDRHGRPADRLLPVRRHGDLRTLAGRISRAIWPQIVWMLVVLLATTYIPAFSLGIQSLNR